MGLPRLIEIRRHFPDRSLPDVYRAVRQEMDSAHWVSAVPSGSRIAVGVGSRGIANIDTIVRAVVDSWLGRGVKPFIIPVMGSHGGGTAQGQREVLAHYGITEQSMGAPVVSSLDVVQVGETPQGIAVSMDKEAWEADGVMLCSRVKWHTGFDGRIESGVHKMMAIGLGKWEGARRYHMWAVRLGLEQVIREVGKVMLATGRMLGGLAILEDANHSSAEVHALGAANMLSREERLLARVKRWKADIPFEAFDLLIVDEIGKNISGSGMDTKVINRSSLGRNCWPGLPRIERIYARSLTPHGGGNASESAYATSSMTGCSMRSISARHGLTRSRPRARLPACAPRTFRPTASASSESSRPAAELTCPSAKSFGSAIPWNSLKCGSARTYSIGCARTPLSRQSARPGP